MEFRTSLHLSKATSRAKSDVANKLVSMLLHEISRRVTVKAGGLSVTDPSYTERVEQSFGHLCLYCGRSLENDRAAVEHLDGMNRFRLGLHVPGNVAVACIWCNREKRRDDQRTQLTLASTGWESFLSHDGKRCDPGCKTCAYWLKMLPDAKARWKHLKEARRKIHVFRANFATVIQESEKVRNALHDSVERLYR
jgi:hypothetical protein